MGKAKKTPLCEQDTSSLKIRKEGVMKLDKERMKGGEKNVGWILWQYEARRIQNDEMMKKKVRFQ